MREKFPEIYKNKINNLKSKVQKDFYLASNDKVDNSKKEKPVKVDRATLLRKINLIFTRPDYIYQADVIIMFKNGENKTKKIVGFKNNELITLDNERISIDEILDIN